MQNALHGFAVVAGQCNQMCRPSRENLVACPKFVRDRCVLCPRVEIGIDELPVCAADRLFESAAQGPLNASDVEKLSSQIGRQVFHEFLADVAAKLEFI